MRCKVYLVLLLLAVLACAVSNCSRNHSHGPATPSAGGRSANNGGGAGGGGGGSGEEPPPGEDPDQKTPANIWINENDVTLTDVNSGSNGTAAPDEVIAFSILIHNKGESLGRIDLADLNIVPKDSLEILTREIDGVSKSDFTLIDVPAESQVTASGTARVDGTLEPPYLIFLGPPEVKPSSPPTEPETVIDPEQIIGFASISINDEETPPPPPPPEVYHTRNPGSLLIFPFYRVEEYSGQSVIKDTLITVTNVNSDQTPRSNGLPGGTIDIRFVYLDSKDCLPFDRWERLTPFDTFSFMVSAHIPYHESSEGWLFVHAVDTDTGESLDFDHLIGHALYFDSIDSLFTSYNPLSFQGIPGHGLPTDIDFDGNCDLNGLEYEQVGDNQMYSRFIATFNDPGQSSFRTDLLLVNLSGGFFFNSSLKFLVFNDNEQAWSTTYDFWCWEVAPLESFGDLFTNEFLQNSNHDLDEELTVFSIPHVETGWFKMNGDMAWTPGMGKVIEDPAFVSLLLEWYNEELMITSPFDNGLQQDNATLWPVSVHGDNED